MMTELWLDSRRFGVADKDDMKVARWMLDIPEDHCLIVHDAMEVVWLRAGRDEEQPVVWPMRLEHVHGQDCGRA